jgi:hypothetical protein
MTIQEDKPHTPEADELVPHYDFDYSKAKLNRFADRNPLSRLVRTVQSQEARYRMA